MKRSLPAYDPNKTWEALDHIKQSNSDKAKEAAEEAVQKTESLTEAETLAKAMEQAAENGMEQATASQAAQDLASLLNSAKLEEGILNGQIPPELLQNLNGLDKEQMEKLVKALELNKNALSMTMSNLANLKMIDPAALAKCQNAGHNPDFAATGGLSFAVPRRQVRFRTAVFLAAQTLPRRAGRRRAGSADGLGQRYVRGKFEI